MKSQSGVAHTVLIAVVLFVVIAGGVGFMFYKNFIGTKQTETAQANKKTGTTKDADISPSPSVVPHMSQSPNATSYFSVGDWGVRFTVPDSLKDTTISEFKVSGAAGYPNTKTVRTDRMKNDQGCGQFMNVSITQTDTYNAHNLTALNSTAIAGHYYAAMSAAVPDNLAACADASVVSKDAAALMDMFKTIEAK